MALTTSQMFSRHTWLVPAVLNNTENISTITGSFTAEPWSKSSLRVGAKSLASSCKDLEFLSPDFASSPAI